MFATAHYFLPIPVALVMVACVGDAQPELVSGIDDTSERVIEAASRAFHNNRETEAVDLLVEHFDGLFLARDFRAAGRALSKLDPQQFPPKVLTGVLMVSAHAREELGSERADFFERVKSALSGKWGLDPESIDSVVRRLK